MILIYVALKQTQPTSAITEVFRTAVEMCEILYAKPECRSRCQILRFHNITFLHSMLCREVFSNPQAVTRGKMFGRYFHAANYHAPLVNRIISPSSLYTELQERMFNKVKSITRTTSNYHPEDMITNILVRLQEEQKQDSNNSLSCLQNAEGEVSKLGQALGEKENTVIPKEWQHNYKAHYQAHLERISDYLIEGPNVWWRSTETGTEFFDVKNCQSDNVLCQHHYRSFTIAEIDSYLLEQWEKCTELNITLPCTSLRTYI